MRRSVLFALAIYSVSILIVAHIAAASDKRPTCGLSCFTAKAEDEKQCSGLQGDQRRECMEKASLRYRNCTTTCATSPEVKSTPNPAVIKSNAPELETILPR
jgi:hypothetical protein